MMFEGKHIHYSPVNQKPLCSYSTKLCKQRRINGYAFCIRHILEDKSAPFKQCAHVARYNKQKCTNPIPCNENREFCNSHMQVAGMLPKKERKIKKEKGEALFPEEGKLKFADRLKALLTKENGVTCTEDLFNSEDPYAFPDTAPEPENGCIAYSATPILRNAWNSSIKNSPEASLDSPVKCDPSSKNSPILDKPKNSIPTLSKTMNRLSAKIAQNKLLDKQKKIQDASQISVPFHNVTIKTEPMDTLGDPSLPCNGRLESDPVKSEAFVKIEPLEERIKSEDSVSVPSPPSVSQADSHLSCGSSEKYFCKSPAPSDLSFRVKNKLQNSDSFKIPLVLRKLQRMLARQRKKSDYVFPRGFDASESESSDSEGENNLFNQLSWFCSWDKRNSSSFQSGSHDSRQVQHTQLKTEFLRSYNQLCQLHSLHRQERKHHQSIVQPLVQAARAYPDQTSELLMSHMKIPVKQKKITKPTASIYKKSETRICSFKNDDMSCSNTALPYTWHCKRHIMYNVDQLLFEHCTAKFSDNTQCCVPVFDVCHELPLCFEHAKKRDNYNRMASEPKPKKPRKKPKPSALTRPPKRGKKKKKLTSIRPSSPPLLSSSIALTSGIALDSHIDLVNVNSFTDNGIKVSEPAPDLNKELNGELHPELESDLEGFSPGAIEKTLDLPLDTAELANQASKLLEEHDFTEVLNKIPDDAFNDLFVDTINGDFIPTREETEKLERELEAVSKDAHLGRDSLAKLSTATSGPDLEELERNFEIHNSILGAENLSGAIDENSFATLSNTHIDSLNVISSSFSTSELNSLTQALSAMNPESLVVNNLPTVSDSVPLSIADLPHSQLLNGHSDVLHTLQLDSVFSSSLVNPAPVQADNKLFGNGSLLSTVLYNIGQPPIVSSSSPEDLAAASSHWLLNSPDILALSQLAYQNGFLVTPSMVGNSNLIGKCDFDEGISLNSGDGPPAPSSIVCNTENVIHSTSEPPGCSVAISGRPTPTNSVKVMVQEGAS